MPVSVERSEDHLKDVLADAQVFIDENLQQMALELVEKMESGTLCSGRVRVLAALLRPVAAAGALTMAERMVELAAVRHAAALTKQGVDA